MKPKSSITFLLLTFCMGACQDARTADEESLSADDVELIRNEATIKAEIGRRTIDSPRWTLAKVVLREPSLGGIPLSPAAIALTNGSLYLIDSSRRVLASWDGTSLETSPVVTTIKDRPLEVPSDLQTRDGTLYLVDSSTLRVVDPKIGPTSTTRFFQSLFAFLPVAHNRAVLSVLDLNGGPELMLVDDDFVTLRTFSSTDKYRVAGPKAAYGLARLARCGKGIAVAYRHRPLILLIDQELRDAHELPVEVPGADRLMASDRNARRRSDEQLGWHPTYFSGIACSQTSIFVLLDLPVLRIYQLSVDGRLQRVIGADVDQVDQSFDKLVVSDSNDGFPMYSIARTRDGRSSVAVITER